MSAASPLRSTWLGRVDYLGDLARVYPNPRIRGRLDQLLQERVG